MYTWLEYSTDVTCSRDMQYLWDISLFAAMCAPAWIFILTTPVAATLIIPFFHHDRPICKQSSLPDIESCFNTGLVGSHNVPKVLCQTCKTCIKISQPYIGHLRWKQINSPNVNWLYSPNIKQNHMGNIEIQIEVT